MLPNDPRHGTYAGYGAGCREDCCRTAARNYHKRRAYEGRPRMVSSVGLRRRIQALACLGWSMYDLSQRLGVSRENVRQWMLHDEVYRSTHETVCALYDELSMTLAPTDTPTRRQVVGKVRKRAERAGWLPPLAWDDDSIDVLMDIENVTNPCSKPIKLHEAPDPIVIERVMAGERVETNRAEREELVRRYIALGRPLADFERMGWKPERYSEREQVAS